VTDRVMFYCQHVLGIGHLVRSAEIVRELARDSHVLLVTGGEIPDGFRLPENIDTLQLTPLKTSPDFSSLQLCDFSRGLEETMEIRRTLLLEAFNEFKPDVLVTELFPFGRKHFRFELLPLLERARSQQSRRTLVVSSVRDILVARKDQEEYEERVCSLVNSFYDLVLVHGDEKFLKLDESFSRVADLCCPVAYTGYVVQQNEANADKPCGFPVVEQKRPAIVVSNGSGQYLTGQMLLESVLRAAHLLQGQIPHEFHVFAGPLMPEEAYSRLQTLAAASGNIKLSRYTPDLAAVLKRADLSVSMAGYNTVMDILSSGVRALVYPVTSNGDQEQSVRAEKLASTGVLDLIRSEELAPEKLAQKLGAALGNEPTRLALNRGGAANSALLLKKYLAMRREHISDVPETSLCPREESVR
jgi:predicted glycosyltransferase